MIGWAVLLVVLGGAGGWALHTLLRPPVAVPPGPDYTVVQAGQGSVGHSIRLNVRAEWPGGTEILGEAAGVITDVAVSDGARVSSGDHLMAVGLAPIIVADGQTPAFRDMKLGDAGPDVAQLQRMLTARGHPVSDSGTFDQATERAVRQWQTDNGIPDSGSIERGTLIFVPGLPARILLADGVAVGRHLDPGQPMFRVLPDRPTFTINLPESQAQMVEDGDRVTIDAQPGTWSARTGPIKQNAQTGERYTVLRPDQQSTDICGAECDSLAVDEPTLLPSRIQVVPEVHGIAVPASAIVTTADGQTAVVMANGDLRGVRVQAGEYGTVIVEGLAEHARVRAPAMLPASDGRKATSTSDSLAPGSTTTR